MQQLDHHTATTRTPLTRLPTPVPTTWHVQSGTGFSCKLDDVHGLQHCNPDTLHATGPPPKDKELQQFQATLLAEHLPVAELQGWLTAYQEDPPCDLLRSKPDSGVWCDVLTGQRSIGSLSNDDVLRLHYVASRECQLWRWAGARACPVGASWPPSCYLAAIQVPLGLQAAKPHALYCGLSPATSAHFKPCTHHTTHLQAARQKQRKVPHATARAMQPPAQQRARRRSAQQPCGQACRRQHRAAG